ncbi:ABC transporter ATP-binding protein [Acidovorax sp. CCYZU-2555]|uniref:ABC transporter ATP-binding protein n=1 Tax=Acidovorax sp. CCYZU-2555 TaxID=2835042 RepID=UPI001BD1515F|nr:ABC transporter ATP-binding protein [Acidovorax sp. CCYZU-2555]MBS7778555.1 ABC transporter ATP-binding protein [Acidovorax sp. CCYZU-2555]
MTGEGVALLQAQGLGKRYGKLAVLEDVALSVAPGSVLGLLGRNGAGKSTLIECLLGLRAADQGQALLFGKPAQALDDDDKAALGYVPQRADGFDWLTVGAMLELVAGLYPQWDHALVARLQKDWKLDARRRLVTLSPGERQQAAIIRAIAPRPRLLVLDEPASALDPLARRALLREIVQLAGEQGSTVLFSTHIISDLERVASHIAVLHQGRVHLHAGLDELKDELRRLVWPAHVPLPDAPLPGELMRRGLNEGASVLVVRGGPVAWPEGVRAQPLGLEDLFVELTA